MSKLSKILETVTNVLGMGGSSAPAIEIPEAKVPAAPAPTRREDAGATVVVGSDSVKNQRVSGKRSSTAKTKGTNVLGGLGGGSGLNL